MAAQYLCRNGIIVNTRQIPVQPQLFQVLGPFIGGNYGDSSTEDLLFPSPNGIKLMHFRRSLQKAVSGAGIEEKGVTPHTLRQACTAQRAQTVTEARLPAGGRVEGPSSPSQPRPASSSV